MVFWDCVPGVGINSCASQTSFGFGVYGRIYAFVHMCGTPQPNTPNCSRFGVSLFRSDGQL